MTPRLLTGLLLLTGLSLLGCSDPYADRYPIEGTVTFKGQPLDSGTIIFVPFDQNSPTQGNALITKGKFSIPKQNGLLVGKYRVAVNSPDGKTPDNDPNAAPGPTGNFASKERIPAKYNTESQQEFEVKAVNPNKYELSIP